MKLNCFLLMLMLGLVQKVSAQYENVWVFGDQAGIDFNTDPPTAITTALTDGFEASASICDATGQLLFYTNGYQVWDRDNDLMPNGTDLAGIGENITMSTAQGALIVPMPGDSNKYYLFSLGSYETYFGRLSYSVVDMTLNNGMGDVMVDAKGILLDNDLMESMTAISGTDCNIWLIAPEQDTFFVAYNINEDGISPNPVLSYRIPEPSELLPYYVEGTFERGCLAVSPDGSKLALSKGNLVLYDFDMATGIISNPVILDENPVLPTFPYWASYYGAAFSDDNSKLYASYHHNYKQFDLAAGSVGAIINSQSTINTCNGLGEALYRGPDEKIYVSSSAYALSTINQPNLAGAACDFECNSYSLNPGTAIIEGFPNYMTVVTHRQVSRLYNDTLYCLDSFLLAATHTDGSDYIWDDSSAGVTHMIYAPGDYSVHYRLTSSCMDETCMETFHVEVSDEAVNVSFMSDSLVCQQQIVAFQNTSSTPYNIFTWDFGDGATNTSTDPQHAYGQPGSDTVMLIGTINGNCPDTAYSAISVDPRQDRAFLPDAYQICMGSAITFVTDMDSTVLSQDWQFGDGIRAYIPTIQDTICHKYDTEGTMPITLQIHFRACPDTLFLDTITVYSFPIVNLSNDTVLCLGGNPVRLENLVHDTGVNHYEWSTGDTTTSIMVRSPGVYTLTVIGQPAGCATTDAVKVNRDCYIDVPNVFTPNNDGVNDYFFPRQLLTKSLTQFKMQVFNRWGQIIFETTNVNGRGWDGKFNNVDQPAGVYVYQIDATISNEGVQHYQGNVTLIR